MILLGIDLGKVRTGLALCDAREVLASPLEVIREPNREKLLARILSAAEANGAQGFVVGLPLNMNGTEGESAVSARAFAAMLSQSSEKPVFLQDERGTTVTAHGYLSETNTRGKKRKGKIDSAAAAIILQDHLEMRRIRRERGEEEEA